jgi:hypothetical protein
LEVYGCILVFWFGAARNSWEETAVDDGWPNPSHKQALNIGGAKNVNMWEARNCSSVISFTKCPKRNSKGKEELISAHANGGFSLIYVHIYTFILQNLYYPLDYLAVTLRVKSEIY